MSRTTPRSINIREVERAFLHLEDAEVHISRYMFSLKAGIEQYELYHNPVPDIYTNHMDILITAMETLQALKDTVAKIKEEI